MNKITATGRLAADAEVRTTNSGDAICSFRVASDVGFGERKSTNWFTCQVWGKRGEAIAQHLVKGQQVTVFGTLTMREWTNKDGIKQLSPEIRIDEIELQGGKRDDASPRQNPAPRRQSNDDAYQRAKDGRGQAANLSDMDQDIPF